MGASQSQPVNNYAEQSSESPVDNKQPKKSGCPVEEETTKRPGCPVDHGGKENGNSYKHPHIYNVYSQRIDPTNQMPTNPNQQPHKEQTAPLSTHRVQSLIPKAGTDETWQYPSPQMFYNSLKRKGKDKDVSEEDMDIVIAIHNNMNERTWKQVMQWEECKDCKDVRLLRFKGRPNNLTPKAWFKTLLGQPAPFDRHDWIVDRCGKEVRYVIDFYHVQEGVESDRVPHLADNDSIRSIAIDARPALDSVESVIDRVWNMFSDKGTRLPSTPQATDEAPDLSKLSDSDVAEFVKTRCGSRLLQFQNCGADEDQCAKAAVALNYCMGAVVCSDSARKFMQGIEAGDEQTEKAYDELTKCLANNEIIKSLFKTEKKK